MRTLIYILILSGLLASTDITAQIVIPGRIRCFGIVVDSLTNEPIAAAVINEITGRGDQIEVKSHVTDNKGKFSFNFWRGDISKRIEISCLGYKVFSKGLWIGGLDAEDGLNLGTIKLAPDPYDIDEVVVRSRMEMFRMSGDTTLYFPRSVNTMEGDAVIEVLRRMPGVEVIGDDAIMIGGKRVERTYISGKLLFGLDVMKPLTTIDAKEAQLIQVYDELDEEDAILKGKDARRRKVLNVVTFRDFDQIFAGEIKAEGGATREKDADGHRQPRYALKGDIGRFNEQLQLQFIGTMDNNGYNIYSDRKQGMAWLTAGGKTKQGSYYNADYSYQNNRTSNDRTVNTDYFATEHFAAQREDMAESSRNRGESHWFILSYPFSVAGVHISPHLDLSFGNNRTSSGYFSSTVRDGETITAIGNSMRGNDRDFNITPRIDVRKRFSKNSLSFDMRGKFSRNSGSTLRKDTIDNAGLREVNVISTDTRRPNTVLSVSLAYRFALNKGSLTLTSSASHSDISSREIAIDVATGETDMARSGDISTKNTTIKEQLSYYLSKDKNYSISTKLAYQGIIMHVDQAIPDRGRHKKYFHAIIPEFSYNNIKNPKATWNIAVSAGQSAPSSQMLGAWIEDADPMSVTAGNPDIRPKENFSAEVGGRMTSDKSSVFSFSLDAGIERNDIITDRTYYAEQTVLPGYNDYRIAAGATLSRPINGKSSYKLGAEAKYDFRLNPINTIFKLSTKYAYANPEYSVDSKLFHMQRHTVTGKIEVATNFSSSFRINVVNDIKYNWYKNYNGSVAKTLLNTAQVNSRLDIAGKAELNVSYKMEYYDYSTIDNNTTSHILNASIGTRVFKNRKGKISFNAYDILNKTRNIATNITDQYVKNTFSRVFSSYYTLSFEYRFGN